MIVESDGLHWFVSDQLSGDRIGPDHEPELRSRILDLLPQGGVFVDVGAHVGCYSIRAAQKASEVHAVEPNIEAIERLESNRYINNVHNMFIYPVAAWDKTEMLTLFSPNSFPRDASMRTLSGRPDATVPAVTLDELLFPFIERADLLKLDVEGADLQALEGMRSILANLKPTLIVEDHSVLGYFSAEALQDKLRDLQYTTELFGTYGGANYWRCEHESRRTA